MKPRPTTLLVALWLVLLSVNTIAAQAPAAHNAIGTQAALGTNFVYQGYLNLNGQPAKTPHDFEFTLYDALTGGTQIGIASTAANQTVSNGVFTVMIDFGAGAFNGSARFMQIRVRPANTGDFVALTPRVELAAVPNAQFSSSTGGLQGRPVSSTAPAPNQVLQWDGSQWVPATTSVTAPLNLSGATGPILTVTNSGTGRGGVFTSVDPGNASIRGENTGANGLGIYGVANNGTNAYGVWGTSANGLGVIGNSTSAFGTVGIQGNGSGYSSSVPAGVLGNAQTGDGVFGLSNSKYGVEGFSATNIGVFGSTANTNSYAGYFVGRVYVNGILSAATKQFKIDHPLDPTNKYLYHTSVESPDMKNIYDGVVTLDANGTAVVNLPDYFQALNQDFRYQLTCIGGFAQIYIEKEIENNHFSIAGGKPGLKVSWQVTGIRHDAYAEHNRAPVEEGKPADERGTYLYPAAYGQPETLGVNQVVHSHAIVEQAKLPEGR